MAVTDKLFYIYDFGDDRENLISEIADMLVLILQFAYEYGYDNSLNISSIKENGNELRLYTYNHLGELIKEELKEENYSFEYQYDALGNRTKKLKIINEHTSVIEENTFDEANRIISTSSGDIIYNSYNELSTATGFSIKDTHINMLVPAKHYTSVNLYKDNNLDYALSVIDKKNDLYEKIIDIINSIYTSINYRFS